MSEVKVEKRVIVETVELVKLDASAFKDAVLEYLAKRGIEQFSRDNISVKADSTGFQGVLLSKTGREAQPVVECP